MAISLTDYPGYVVSWKNTCLLQAGKAKPLNDAAAVALLKSGDEGWEPESVLHCGRTDVCETTHRQITHTAIPSSIIYVLDLV